MLNTKKILDEMTTDELARLSSIVRQNIRHIERNVFRTSGDKQVLREQKALLKAIQALQSERIVQLPLF
jgi:nanoRNase/pAp phosphatase (c-di-AMP/oligoRNAs hydrolase)